MNIKTSNFLKPESYIDKNKLLEIRKKLILNVTEDLLIIMENKVS